MERRHYIPSYKALPLEVEDRELLSGHVSKATEEE